MRRSSVSRGSINRNTQSSFASPSFRRESIGRQGTINARPHRSVSFATSRAPSSSRRSSIGFSRRASVSRRDSIQRRPSFGGGTWTSDNNFVRTPQYGWFRRMPPAWFVQYPWFLPWMNARYPFPLVVLSAYDPIIIPATISLVNSFLLESYIAQVQQQAILNGTAPANAYLVPNFATDPPSLNWAARADAT